MCWCTPNVSTPCCGAYGCDPPPAKRQPPNLYDVDASLELALSHLANNRGTEAARYLVGLRNWIATATPAHR